MSEPLPSGMSTIELLGETWNLMRTHARTFLLITGVPIAALLIYVIVMALFLVPDPAGRTLREVWLTMGTWNKAAIALLFLALFPVLYRALAASVFAAAEIRSGRDVGVVQAFRHIRRKQLRLFWIILLINFLTAPIRPLALIIALVFALLCAPAFPVAILENLGAFKALERGNQLAKGGFGRIALLFILYLAPIVVGIFGYIGVLVRLQEHFGVIWYSRLLFFLWFWLLLLIPQAYMVALTLNYFDQRVRKGELGLVNSAGPVALPAKAELPV